ncbi:MAG: helix-turn-helix domain-containing protein [Mesorhizobium sp.]|nr:helix-turn-helix transcriptional regulator [Mesorhizobium sp.]MCO5161898.1 helix-turn-helix domain-containing protein [Mesorhizobium sp.]
MTTLTELKQKLRENPEFDTEYRKAEEEYAVIEALIAARTSARLSQADLAARLGTTQSAIARLESGRISPSLSTLRRYAEATGTRLTLSLTAR